MVLVTLQRMCFGAHADGLATGLVMRGPRQPTLILCKSVILKSGQKVFDVLQHVTSSTLLLDETVLALLNLPTSVKPDINQRTRSLRFAW